VPRAAADRLSTYRRSAMAPPAAAS
jgi:hypothetical protein